MIPSAEPIPLEMNSDGVILVGGTRVTLDTVIAAHLENTSPNEIVEQYPSLALADVYAAIAYFLRHREEVETYLERRQQESERVRRENEARFDPKGIQERLLSRC